MIPALVLAAGTSSRMGRPKATLPLGPGTFLTRIVRSFRDAGVHDIAIVVGHHANEIMSSWPRQAAGVRFVVNPDYMKGQFSSLLAGLDAVDGADVEAVLMTLVDVPLVAASTVRAVIDRYRETGAPIVRPTRGAEHGHPVLIDRTVFAAIRAADPDVGAKSVVRSYASPAGDFESADGGAFLDIDTMAEYERALATFFGKEGDDEG